MRPQVAVPLIVAVLVSVYGYVPPMWTVRRGLVLDAVGIAVIVAAVSLLTLFLR